MNTGWMLLRMARAFCSVEECERVLEPAIADLQHDVRSAVGIIRLRKLAGGYAAFWSAFTLCVVHDLSTPESVRFLGRTAAVFAAIVGSSFALEWMLVSANSVIRVTALVFSIPYVGWYARFTSATLMFVVPIAGLPALRHARKRARSVAGVTGFSGVAVGVVLTVFASGWLAPALERAKIVRQHRDFVQRTHGQFYLSPIEVTLDRNSTSKSLPDLVRAALAPPAHRFPGYPNYVAPEDRFSHDGHWRDLRFRALLVLISAAAGTIGLRLRTSRT